jgi:hypothetical protein
MLEPTNQNIRWGNSSNTLKAIGKGSIKVSTPIGNITLENVYLVPDFSVNIISLSTITKKGVNVIFKEDLCSLNIKNKSIKAILNQGLFLLPFTPNTTTVLNSTTKELIWHQRLGHLGDTTLKYLPAAVKELPKEDTIIVSNNSKECETCLKSKFKATISREPSTKRTEFLQLITSDLCGPFNVIGLGGYRYFITFLDVATRWLETYPIKSKTDVYSFIRTYKEKQENQSSKRIKAFKSDNGTEYTNSKVKELFTSSGIEHLLSAPYTPEQNGLIERINLTILNKIRCILTESNTTKEL